MAFVASWHRTPGRNPQDAETLKNEQVSRALFGGCIFEEAPEFS
jgi:hypothetical protein